MRMLCVLSLALLSVAPGVAANAQSQSEDTTLTVRSNLVLVPALVKTREGELVFSLTADDFVLTDNGVPQTLQLEPDTDAQPVALAVIVQTGGKTRSHLGDYSDLTAVLDAVMGNVPHRVAVISFDSRQRLEQDFTADTDAAAHTIANLQDGDPGAAILDALNFGIGLLRQQPPDYRRVVLLFSETIDNDSHTSFADAVRAVDDTNTSIYSFAYSSQKAALKHQGSKLSRSGGTDYSSEPYAQGGCMSREANADPDAHGKRSVQALDCASDLIPPLRLARLAFIAATDSLKRNVPESVAQLTGGEYFPFKDAKTLKQHLVTIANDVPNRYVLSFHPQSPQPGLHALDLKLAGRPGLELKARNAYWVDAVPAVGKK